MPPSEDLTDEVEAINSIYGAGTLVLDEAAASAGTAAVLALPTSSTDFADPDDPYAASHRLSLRLLFPAGYPAGPDPPAVQGVQSIGDAGSRGGSRRPGAASGEVDRFRAAVVDVFQEGLVCLFDAIEGYLQGEEEEDDGEENEGEEGQGGPSRQHGLSDDDLMSPEQLIQQMEPPEWILSEPFVERQSVFLARCARVSSPAQAYAFVRHLLATEKRVRTATHNMTAWRIRDPDGGAATFQDCDDDGETAAGGRLLHLMQLMDLWDVMVVVTRWYGGHKLGPRRFALINQAARDAFVRAGLVVEPAAKKKGHK